MGPEPGIELSVSEFVDLLNQTLEYAYGGVTIIGELANLRVSKNRWVYFDLKDESSTVKFFGTVYQLPGPLEDGMIIKVRGQPKLHNLYGFSVNVQSMRPAGEGTIKRAAELLQAKLQTEGLFDASRKRPLPYPPTRIGLIASKQSAAYADFIKIMNARWGGVSIEHIDVQVQGDPAPGQIVAAVEQFNASAEPPEVLVIIRGGGSAEDLAAFSTEQVTRAVAASRIPTLVAIGHEVDVSLAELAADCHASTPSNAAELLVPDREARRREFVAMRLQLHDSITRLLSAAQRRAVDQQAALSFAIEQRLASERKTHAAHAQLLHALSPQAILRRGYAVVRHNNTALRTLKGLSDGAIVDIQLADGHAEATIANTKGKRPHGN